MAYFVSSNTFRQDSGTTFSMPIPTPHASGDLILVKLINVSAAGSAISAPSGYTGLGATTTISSVSRVQCFYKLATSSSEAAFSVTVQNAETAASISVWRGVDQTTPIDASNNGDSTSNAATFAGPTTTTTTANCVLEHTFLIRSGGKILPSITDMGRLVAVDRPFASTVNAAILSGYEHKDSSGATSAVTIWNNITSSTTGRAFVIAIRDASPSTPSMGPMTSTPYDVIKLHMGITGAVAATDSFSRNESTTWNDGNGMTPTTIAGLSVISATPTVSGGSFQDPIANYGASVAIGVSVSGVDATGRWVGAYHTLSSYDLSGKIFAMSFGMNSLVTTNIGSEGCIIVFEDGSGHWAAYTLSKRQNMEANVAYTSFIAPGVTTPLDSSGVMDWTDVAKVGYFYHRVTSSTLTRNMLIRLPVALSNTIIYQGCSSSPITVKFLDRIINYWGAYKYVDFQGIGQVVTKGNVTFGDGTHKSYIDLGANSNEQPNTPDGTFAGQYWQGGANALTTKYNLSSNDTLKLSRSVLSSPIQQNIDAVGSTPSSFDASGATYIKQAGKLVGSVTYSRATFSQCGLLDMNGATLDTCSVSNSTGTSAVTTADASKVVGTAFTSAGTGHAVRITTAGTYSFEGNTFSGYAASNGTTGNEAFYNDSGGLITLEIPSGGAVPSIRNGSGASTVIDTPTDNQSVTISGAASGSRIQIYDLTSATELYNGTPTFPYTWTDSSAYVADREIRLRVSKVGASTAKQFIETIIGTSTEADPALSYLVTQEDDTVYASNAIDGSTVTDVTKNSGTDRFEINKSSGTISAASLYAYEMYYLFTSTGIAADTQVITATDTANYFVGSSYKFKNVTTGPNVALTITGGWVRDSSTGLSITTVDTTGYTIFNAPDHVVAYATGSGVTPTDITDIADAVWDEVLSGHATSGTTGEALSNSGGSGAVSDYYNATTGDYLTPI